tara:strand:+ start:2604 stop:2831 length:228 start_codon:yes stop_codon:yes gene_type:complete
MRKTEIQAVRVPKNMSLGKARQKVTALGFNQYYRGKSPFTQTENEWRFRQTSPKKYKTFRTKTLDDGIKLIVGIL